MILLVYTLVLHTLPTPVNIKTEIDNLIKYQQRFTKCFGGFPSLLH